MQIIPLADIRSCGPKQLVHDYPKQAKELIIKSRKTLGMGSELISRAVLQLGDRVSRDWLIETNNPYLDEIDHYADHLNMTGVHALNICYEWGCTSGVYAKEDGPALTRVLDWPFPKLGEHIVVALQHGGAGDFYNVTWPGVKRHVSWHGAGTVCGVAEPSPHAAPSADLYWRLDKKPQEGF